MQTKHEVFDWSAVLGLFGISGANIYSAGEAIIIGLGLEGMNVFEILQGVLGVVGAGLACYLAYWRAQASREKALARRKEIIGEDRRDKI